MPRSIPCPKCKKPILIEGNDSSSSDRVTCSACGAVFRIQKKPGVSVPQPKASAPQAKASGPQATAQVPASKQQNAIGERNVESRPAAKSKIEKPAPPVDKSAQQHDDSKDSSNWDHSLDEPTQGSDADFFDDDWGDASDTASDADDPYSNSYATASSRGSEAEDPYPALPPRRVKPTKSVRKPPEEDPEPERKSGFAVPKLALMVGGIVTGALALVLIVSAVIANSGANDGGSVDGNSEIAEANGAEGANANGNAGHGSFARGNQSDFTSLNRSSHPVIFDEPIAGITADPQPEIQKDSRQDKVTFADVTPLKNVAEPAVVLPEDEPPAPTPLWQIEPDPAPADSEYAIAPDIRFDLTSPGVHNGNLGDHVNLQKEAIEVFPSLEWFRVPRLGSNKPIMAGQQGPFMIQPPTYERAPFAWKLTPVLPPINYNWKKCEVVEHSPGDIPLIDLRTGKPTGMYNWRIPFWLRPALSPDGQTLVGPHHEFPIPEDIARRGPVVPEKKKEKELKEWTEKRHSLFVWKLNDKSEPKPMLINGEVSSMMFADNQTLLVLVEMPERQLEIWNTEKASRTAVVPIPQELQIPPEYPANHNFSEDRLDLAHYPPLLAHILAASPTGKYAAVMSKAGVVFLSLREAKIQDVLPLSAASTDNNTSVSAGPSTQEQLIAQQAPAGEFSGTQETCRGLEFLPSGDRLMVAYGDSLGQLRIRFFDVATGVLVQEKTWKTDHSGAAIVSPDMRSLSLIDYPRTDNRGSETRFYDFDKQNYEVDLEPYVMLRYPKTGPMLVIRQDGDMRPDPPQIPFVMTVPRETWNAEIAPRLAVNDDKMPKRIPAVVADRTGLKRFVATPPPEWKPLPPIAPHPDTAARPEATARSFAPKNWPTAWSDKLAISFEDPVSTDFRQQIFAQLIKWTDGQDAPATNPVELLPYGISSKRFGQTLDLERNTCLITAVNSSGDRFAFGDPDVTGRIEVWSGDGQRQFAFRTSRAPQHYAGCVGFNAAGQLLTLEGGTLSAWTLGTDNAAGVFAVTGDYRRPIFLSPDQRLAVISRGSSFDILDLATGECLARCALENSGDLIDAAFCPDGQHLAVSYVKDRSLAVAIWNLSTGSVRMSTGGYSGVHQVTWASPEHLIFNAPPTVYDLTIEDFVMTYDSGETQKSPDGRLWFRQHSDDEAASRWRLMSLFGKRTEDEERFFDKDRQRFELQSTPVRVEIDLGDSQQGISHGQKAVEALQKAGWKIGNEGFVIRITFSTSDSGLIIAFGDGQQIAVPNIIYTWQLLDSLGREVHAGRTVGRFPYDESKYVTKVDYETRVTSGGDAFFNFRGKDPRQAILEEILENGDGLTVAPSFPATMFVAGGKNHQLPVKLAITAAE